MRYCKIRWYEHQLRFQYLKATQWQVHMDCGHALAIYINPNIIKFEQQFNKIADKLSILTYTTQFRF